MDVIVTDNPAERRFEAHLDGELAGQLEYELAEGLMTFTHTFVDADFEGRGVGSALAQRALDDVRANRPGLAVVPECDFVKGWIERHADYQDLLVGRRP